MTAQAQAQGAALWQALPAQPRIGGRDRSDELTEIDGRREARTAAKEILLLLQVPF